MITSILRIFLTRSIEPFVLGSDQEDVLTLDEKNLGLYIHIPFCKKICSFCPYYKVLYDRDLMEKYIAGLFKEIKLVGALNENKAKITSVYFGGGSPALAIDFLSEIMGRIRESFSIGGNIGIELHPRDIDKNLIKCLKSIGFDMISIGVQSFQEKCLHALGRDSIDNIEKVRIAAEGGFKIIDIDLIFGIPGQTAEDIVSDFEIAANNGATQISTYPFIEFSYSDLKTGPAGRNIQKKMLEDLIDISQRKGFKHTSVWTFSKKGHGTYSSVTRDNYIGFGPGAASLTKNIFKINTFSVEEYTKCLSGGKLPTALTLKFNKRRRALYWLFWSAYSLHLNRASFRDLFNEKFDSFFGLEIFIGKKLKLIREEEGGYEITAKGAQLYHLMEQVYTHQYIDKTWKIALSDPWPEKIILY
ncbi:MAG: radical SAM protein [Actinomycetia bacterium]|nr:radical SAM protein [Actinomycetes bacterium]